MQILFFGTYDEQTHPRVRVLREGLLERGNELEVCNAQLGVSTDIRVELARQPWRLPALLARIASRWARLLWAARGRHPEVVVVGYLGHFDVHLARLRFPRATIVLDHMVGLGETVRDRGLGARWRAAGLLDAVDRAATRAADIVVVDTEEHRSLVAAALQDRVVVVPVGAPLAWAVARPRFKPGHRLRVVFYGLYTPLQGAPVIGEAIRATRGAPITYTMIGRGQDLEPTRVAVGDDPRVAWMEWVEESRLPELVASHDVCLGIFGDSDKSLRVVPNKVYQGAAAGCAIITSDTPPQRRILGGAARYVRPGDADALAQAIRALAAAPEEVTDLRAASAALADRCFTPASVVAPLSSRLEGTT